MSLQKPHEISPSRSPKGAFRPSADSRSTVNLTPPLTTHSARSPLLTHPVRERHAVPRSCPRRRGGGQVGGSGVKHDQVLPRHAIPSNRMCCRIFLPVAEQTRLEHDRATLRPPRSLLREDAVSRSLVSGRENPSQGDAVSENGRDLLMKETGGRR